MASGLERGYRDKSGERFDYWGRTVIGGMWYYLHASLTRVVLSCWGVDGRYCYWREIIPRGTNLGPAFNWAREFIMKWVGKKAVAAGGDATLPDAVDLEFSAQYPALTEYLTADRDDEGKARETATLMVNITDGRFNVGLHDRQDHSWLWKSSNSLSGALTALEMAIQDGTGDWRKTKGKNSKR